VIRIGSVIDVAGRDVSDAPQRGGDGWVADGIEHNGARRGFARAGELGEPRRLRRAERLRRLGRSRRRARSGAFRRLRDRLARIAHRNVSGSMSVASGSTASTTAWAARPGHRDPTCSRAWVPRRRRRLVGDDLDLRTERIGRVLGGDDREFVGVQAHERADREQAHQVDEPLQQHLVERGLPCSPMMLRMRTVAMPSGTAVAAQRVEDVGNRHDHRAQVQLAAADLLG
jgi:hypothetical protein